MISFSLVPLTCLRGGGGWGKGVASDNSLRQSRDGLKEIGTRFHHPFCKFIIAHLICNVIKLLHCYPMAQIASRCRQRFKPLIRRHNLLIRVHFPDLTSLLGNRYREETRPVEVDIGVKVFTVIPV